jgi:2,4-dienoyl-CoA reductase-like NADH-dependent reductase (Old Yellow Enzyme family)
MGIEDDRFRLEWISASEGEKVKLVINDMGFLLGQFISPLTNQRRDRYGGTLENRTRFAVEVVRKVRDEVGSGFPVLYRLGCDDLLPGGLTLDEGKKVAEILVNAGVDVMDVQAALEASRLQAPSGQGFLRSPRLRL